MNEIHIKLNDITIYRTLSYCCHHIRSRRHYQYKSFCFVDRFAYVINTTTRHTQISYKIVLLESTLPRKRCLSQHRIQHQRNMRKPKRIIRTRITTKTNCKLPQKPIFQTRNKVAGARSEHVQTNEIYQWDWPDSEEMKWTGNWAE